MQFLTPPSITITIIRVLPVFSVLCILLLTGPLPLSQADPFFEDGYLGLNQEEVHQKLGIPHAIRSRKAALRVFHYYSVSDWDKYFRKLVSPENGEDVYTYDRDGIQVRYSFVYTRDLREAKDFPTLFVKRVEVEFTPAIPLDLIPKIVKEFHPPQTVDAPVFRSNLWLLFFKGSASPQATLVVQERDKENWEWSLAYQMFSLQGIPNHLTSKSKIDRLEFTVQSLPFIKKNHPHTHELILNPYSPEFANRPPESPQVQKGIPVPQYAE